MRLTPDRQGAPSQLKAVLAANGFGFSSYYLLLPVVPLAAESYGGTVVSGAATAVFMSSTVATQFFVPMLSNRLSAASLLSASGVMLGVPTLGYIWHVDAGVFFAATVLRGVGFGILTAAGSAAVLSAAGDAEQGHRIGLYGLFVSLPALALPSLGVHVYDTGSATAVYVVGAALSVAVLLFTPVLRAAGAASPPRSVGVIRAARLSRLRVYSTVFVPYTMAYGVVFTFVPLWERHADLVLLGFAISFTFARLLSGHGLTVRRARRLFAGSAATGIAAAVVLAWTHGLEMFVPSFAIGASVGCAATTTLFLVTAESTPDEHSAGAALWSVAFDGGIGLGALGMAAIATVLPHRSVYLILVPALALSLLPLRTRPGATADREGPDATRPVPVPASSSREGVR